MSSNKCKVACDFEKTGHFLLGALGGMAEVVHRIGEIEAEMSGGSERSIEEKRRIT